MRTTVANDAESVLLVEDDDSLRELLEQELGELGLRVVSVSSAEAALSVVARTLPTLIVSDMRLPGIDGIALLDRMQELRPSGVPPFIVISAFGSVDRAVEALKRGAVDFMTKPLDLEHLRLRVQRFLDVERLKRRVASMHVGTIDAPFHGILGRSPPMCRLIEDIRQVATATGSVLVIGDSGVGKELVARAIHRESARARGPFVPVNCASVPSSLLESEFFGYEGGSFTGANKARVGLFAAAEGGTIFLDEVGELPVALQAKLLRVIQERAVRRVGATAETELDVRVLAATNRRLDDEMALGRFRNDLFFRLGTFVIDVPPLAVREGDVELLAAYFLGTCARPQGKRIDGFSADALDRLKGYPFPGNVRELENVIEHAVTFCRGSLIELHDLPPRVRARASIDAQSTASIPLGLLAEGEVLTLQELTVRYVRRVVSAVGDNKRRAARLLGISRQTLYRHLQDGHTADSRQDD